MRFIRYRDRSGTIRHGRIESDQVQPLIGDLFGDLRQDGQPFALAGVELLAPVAPPNVIAIGRNYLAHAREGNDDAPKAPIVFIKTTTTIADPGAPVRLPTMAPDEVDYEAELAVVIGKTARDVSEDHALDHVFGYTCANDISARDCQRGDAQWARGKCFDGFCPLGPWIETELDPRRTRLRLLLNGATMQDASTAQMIFPVAYLISYLSRCMTLLPGTVILTGTPEGCGFARKPPVWLRPGDRVEVAIDGIGSLTNPIVAATTTSAAAAPAAAAANHAARN